jgi:mono/diheme cytochrome c family protein
MLACAAVALAVLAFGARAQTAAPSFTRAQADHGGQIYAERCAACHGPNLDDGSTAPSLKGARFRRDWGGKSAGDLFRYLTANMPPGQAGVLAGDDYADVMAFLLQAEGGAPGDQALPADAQMLSAMVLPN